MVDYIKLEDQEYVLLAYRNVLLAIDVSYTPIYSKQRCNDNFVNVRIEEENIYKMRLDKEYKIFCLIEIGDNNTAIVLEDLSSRQIRFLRIKIDTCTSQDSVLS